jgi:hypothetical protein
MLPASAGVDKDSTIFPNFSPKTEEGKEKPQLNRMNMVGDTRFEIS